MKDINANPAIVENPAQRGPHSKYTIPDESRLGTVELKWVVQGENGVACELESRGRVSCLLCMSATSKGVIHDIV